MSSGIFINIKQRSTARVLKTGQTTSYRTGDDGDLKVGRLTDFLTLGENNPFGNTNRFTDELGGQTYTNNIAIDWATFDGTNVLGWRKTNNGADISWNDSIDGALLVSIGSYTTGWRLPNAMELMNICKYDTTRFFNYAPFNDGLNNWYWTSTTAATATTTAFALGNQGGNGLRAQTKTNTAAFRYYPCRTFTVTGTVLT